MAPPRPSRSLLPALLGAGLVLASAAAMFALGGRPRGPALTADPARASAAPPPTAAPAARSRAAGCEGLQADTEASLRSLEASDAGAGCPFKRPEVNCIQTGRVLWGYRLVSAKAHGDPNGDEGQCETELKLELVRDDGSGLHALAGADEKLDYAWYTYTNEVKLQPLADYDGDGEVEILRTRSSTAHEASPSHDADVLTFRGGKLSDYAPAKDLPIDSARDVDGDGRPDLLTPGPYSGVTREDGLGNSWPVAPALLVWHSLPDGTFSLTDAQATAFARSQCPSRPALRFTQQSLIQSDETAHDVICARLWGASEAEVAKAWDALCGRHDSNQDPYSCQPWPKALAAIKPPLSLR